MSRPAEAPVALGDPFEAETQVGSLPLLEADRLRALPEGLAPELSEFRGPFEHRGEMVPASWPALLANAVGPYGTRISVSLTPLG